MAADHGRQGEGVSQPLHARQCLVREGKSAGVVCDGWRVIFLLGEALSAGMAVWVISSAWSPVAVTGRMWQRC